MVCINLNMRNERLDIGWTVTHLNTRRQRSHAWTGIVGSNADGVRVETPLRPHRIFSVFWQDSDCLTSVFEEFHPEPVSSW